MFLSKKEIKERLARLSNLERLYTEARKRIEQQDALISERAQLIKKLQEINEQLLIRVEQLEKMIFGSKRNKKGSNAPDTAGASTQSSHEASNRKRSPDSYRRSCPNDTEITETRYHAVKQCRHCALQLTDIEEHIRYH